VRKRLRPRSYCSSHADTQRPSHRTDDLLLAISEPFRCRWTFDVELIARFVSLKRQRAAHERAEALIYELPLRAWADVPGSKLGPLAVVRMAFELAFIYRTYGLRRWTPQRRADAAEGDAANAAAPAAEAAAPLRGGGGRRGASPKPRPRARK
jgi:hypothetical protein